ncbi:MAG: hypothetical protein CL945_10370 [Dinoroseobacter sp.]|nr:hypothetical protein [Dinoroseobacter sp.]
MSDTTAPSGSPMTRYLPLIVIALVAASGWFFFRDYLSFEALRDNREALLAFRDANYLAMVAGYIVAYVAIVAFSLPGATPATLAGGFLFGLFPGAFYVVVSATLGAIVIFLAAKWGLGEALAARMDASSGRIKRIKEGIEANELPMLFLIRLVPAVPFFVANLLPALVGVALGPYVFTTFFGIMPGTVVYTWVGAGLGEVFARGDTPDLGIIFEPMILGPILGLCALALLPIVIRAVRGKEGV